MMRKSVASFIIVGCQIDVQRYAFFLTWGNICECGGRGGIPEGHQRGTCGDGAKMLVISGLRRAEVVGDGMEGVRCWLYVFCEVFWGEVGRGFVFLFIFAFKLYLDLLWKRG